LSLTQTGATVHEIADETYSLYATIADADDSGFDADRDRSRQVGARETRTRHSAERKTAGDTESTVKQV